jgi:hypothetical protein
LPGLVMSLKIGSEEAVLVCRSSSHVDAHGYRLDQSLPLGLIGPLLLVLALGIDDMAALPSPEFWVDPCCVPPKAVARQKARIPGILCFSFLQSCKHEQLNESNSFLLSHCRWGNSQKAKTLLASTALSDSGRDVRQLSPFELRYRSMPANPYVSAPRAVTTTPQNGPIKQATIT